MRNTHTTDTAGTTLDIGYWRGLVAASTYRLTAEQIEAVAQYAFANGCGVWHAVAETIGKGSPHPCQCRPCADARAKAA